MDSTNGILIFGGVACFAASLMLFRGLVPEKGEPPSVLVRTEIGASLVAIVLLVLMLVGIALVVKGTMS